MSNETRIYEINECDSVWHWVIAESADDARRLWVSTGAADDLTDDEVTAMPVTEVPRERAENLRVFDDDGSSETMWASYERDPSRQYLACSEW